ncbi:MAG: hypothetical protein R6V08_11150 [Desulfuromonadales bacterium]
MKNNIFFIILVLLLLLGMVLTLWLGRESRHGYGQNTVPPTSSSVKAA